jgi:hypothetical protein
MPVGLVGEIPAPPLAPAPNVEPVAPVGEVEPVGPALGTRFACRAAANAVADGASNATSAIAHSSTPRGRRRASAVHDAAPESRSAWR